jgi:RNA polymerase sigma-70 factor (ECF subfamily)
VQGEATERLLQRAAKGDAVARDELFAAARGRLRQLIAVRMDVRIAARVDASDIVQETLSDAVRRWPDFLRGRPAPFYLWLRQIALDRLADAHRRHLRARVRSVRREDDVDLSDESAAALASHLASTGGSPLSRLMRVELRDRLRAGMAQLAPADRDLLVMRFLEQLRASEVASLLQISESAVRGRLRRAMERLQRLVFQTGEA